MQEQIRSFQSSLFERSSPCHTRLGCIVALSLAIFFTRETSQASTIRDGNNFSISIESPGTRTCILFPPSARDPAACAGLTLATKPPSDAKGYLAIGQIRFPDAGSAATATLVATVTPAPNSTEPDEAAAEQYAWYLQKGAASRYPQGSIRSGTFRAEIRVIGGLKTVRASFDLDARNGDNQPVARHEIAYLAWAEDSLYIFVLSTDSEHGAALDGIADSSARTINVAHPAQPALSRPAVAVFLWLIFAAGVFVNTVWVFLRQRGRLMTPASLSSMTTLEPFLGAAAFDVSRPARLRKRLRWAAGSLKIIGPLTAIEAARHMGHLSDPARLFCALPVLGCALLVSKRLRAGSVMSAWVAGAYGVFLAGSMLIELPTALKVSFTFYKVFYSAIWFATSVIPIGFLVPGLLAFRAMCAYQEKMRRTGDPLAIHPWEKGLYVSKRPKLVNRRSIAARLFLLASPVPYLWVWATPFAPDKAAIRDSVRYGPSFEAGYIVGLFAGAFAITFGAVAWGTRIYRRARREAMVSASEVIEWDTRPFVLYLRSFQDDGGIKLRARATDGRILPERLLKISFEELIADHLWGYGPVLAIGNPGSKQQLTPLGAARDYPAEDANWREIAADLISRASMIVMIVGATQGLAWEVDSIVERQSVSKLVLLFPPLGTDALNARWQFLSRSAIGPSLPTDVDLQRTRAIVFLNGKLTLINGDERNEWTYEAVLDEAALIVANRCRTLSDLPLQLGAGGS